MDVKAYAGGRASDARASAVVESSRKSRAQNGWLPVLKAKRLAKQSGKHRVGPNAYLDVDPKSGRATWGGMRYSFQGRARWMGLGSFDLVSLAEVRDQVEAALRKLRDGADPLEEARAAKQASVAAKTSSITFADASARYMKDHEAGWRSAKHLDQWRSSIRRFALPVIGDIPVREIRVDDVLATLYPIWHAKPETAKRLRSRIELVIDTVLPDDARNPASWRGRLKASLPATKKLRPVVHFTALDWRAIPQLMIALKADGSAAAQALQWVILSGARSNAVRGMRWPEIDGDTWSIPPTRMKNGKPFRCPVNEGMRELLRSRESYRRRPDDLVFRSPTTGRALATSSFNAVLRRLGYPDATTHGMRSALTDWAHEQGYDRLVIETQLSHTVGNGVEMAYRRGDLLDRRRTLAWSQFTQDR